MNIYRVSYQNAMDKVIRNRHARVKARDEDEARALVFQKAGYIAIYKIEQI